MRGHDEVDNDLIIKRLSIITHSNNQTMIMWIVKRTRMRLNSQ